jgi:hypothetical protein
MVDWSTYSDHHGSTPPFHATPVTARHPRPLLRRHLISISSRRPQGVRRNVTPRRAARAHVARRLPLPPLAPPPHPASRRRSRARGRRRCASARRTSPHLPAPSSFSDPDATLRLHYSASRPGPAVHVTPRLLPFASRRPPLVLFPTSCGIWPRTYSAPSRFPVSVFFILRARRVEWGGRCSRIKEKGWTKKTVLSLCGRRFARRSLAEAV